MNSNIEYKVSRYTFLINNEKRYYIYNSLSNALIEIDEELYQFLNDAKKNNHPINSLVDTDIVTLLKSNRFIAENNEDEFLTYKSIIMAMRGERDSISLTIAPTMDCCFNCHYCFEKSKQPTYMSQDVMKGISKFIGTIGAIKRLNLTWFGGEPLMAVPEMERLYRKLRRRLKGVAFRSSIITTGFHLTEENIRALQRLKIIHIQVTLDGLKESHNKIKHTEGCDDAFSVVLDNIERTCELAPEIHIVIRTNLTKNNAHEYQELQRMILQRFAGKNISIAPAFVMDVDGCEHSQLSELFTKNEYPKYILGLAEKGVDTPQVRYPEKYFNECAIRNALSFSFDPEGNLYKCWEHIGESKYALGKINKNGVIENINETLLNRQMYGADPLEDPVCRKCAYLPICHGGCPIQRVENAFYDGQNVCCTYYKGHINEFILEHIRRKESMEKSSQ
ncbi:MAG: SPASM domain-containing protein [Bacteroidales bacterium]|nr:SPASM domain-containing protein [Bacteroidales bacterium]